MLDGDQPKATGSIRGRPFRPGNPGRPKGARKKPPPALDALLGGQVGAIAAKAA